MKKRALSILLVLLLALSLLPGPALAVGEDGLDSDVIGVIVEGIESWETEIDVCDYGILKTEIADYIRYVTYGHPELFYITNSMGYSISDGYVTTIRPEYDDRFTKDNIGTFIETFESVCETIVAGIPDGSTTEEKLLYIHDYIVTHCEYDSTPTKCTAYDCLVLGSAVCDGYSRAFLYLCSLARLNVHFIGSNDLCHSWNVAYVKNSTSPSGAYYYIDCTWDDPTNYYNPSHCLHDQFLMYKEKCMEGHTSSDWTDENGVNAYADYETNEAYRNYWWTKCIRPVQWIDSLMCYAKMNDRSHVFFRESGSSTETAISLPASAGNDGIVYWNVWGATSYYDKNYITVASLAGNFYFSTPTQVWKVTTGKQMSLVYTLSSAEQAKGYIYGLRAQDGKLYYDVATSPDAAPAYTGALNIASITITSHPSSTSAALGATATFKVVASGSGLSYQWQYQKPGESTWNNVQIGGTSATFNQTSVASRHNGYKFRCKVTNSGGSVTSNPATLSVSGGSSAPTISSHPSSVTVSLGATATFKVVASGSGLTYQWQYLKPGESTWNNVQSSGGTSATFNQTNVASRHNGYKFRCKVTGSGGSVTSNPATLTVGTPPTITSHPSSVTVALGSTATFKVAASGSGLTYQWQYLKPGESTWNNVQSSGGNSATFNQTNVASRHNGYKFRCKVTGSGGTVCSDVATLTLSVK